MAHFETSDAEPVYNSLGVLAGYIREHATDLWLPLDTTGENLTGPTYRQDAQGIVLLAALGKL